MKNCHKRSCCEASEPGQDQPVSDAVEEPSLKRKKVEHRPCLALYSSLHSIPQLEGNSEDFVEASVTPKGPPSLFSSQDNANSDSEGGNTSSQDGEFVSDKSLSQSSDNHSQTPADPACLQRKAEIMDLRMLEFGKILRQCLSEDALAKLTSRVAEQWEEILDEESVKQDAESVKTADSCSSVPCGDIEEIIMRQFVTSSSVKTDLWD